MASLKLRFSHFRTWKWMIGILEYDRFFLGWPIFRGKLLVSGSVRTWFRKQLLLLTITLPALRVSICQRIDFCWAGPPCLASSIGPMYFKASCHLLVCSNSQMYFKTSCHSFLIKRKGRDVNMVAFLNTWLACSGATTCIYWKQA